MKIVIIFFTIVLPTILSTQCETKAWPPDESARVKERQVNLDLPPEDRWTEIMQEHKARYVDLVLELKSHFKKTFHLPDGFFPKFEKFMVNNLDSSLPEEYAREIRGMAKAVDLHESYVLLTNIIYDFIALCTAAVRYDPASDGVIHLRNLDFGAMFGWDSTNSRWIIQECLQGLLMSLDFRRGGKTQFRSVTYAGSVGVLTGMRPGVFGVSINARFALDGGFLGLLEWFSNTDRNQSFVSLLTRTALDDPDTSYLKAVELLSSRRLISPVFFVVSGVQKNEGCVLARGRKRLVDRWDMSSDSSDLHLSMLVQTNYDRTKPQPIFDDRVNPVYTCVKRDPDQNVTASLYNALSTYPMSDSMTIHTTIMNVNQNILVSYLRNFTM